MSSDHRRRPEPPSQDRLLPDHKRSEFYKGARVRLVLVGEDVDPAVVSGLLGCAPDHGNRRGERTPTMDSSVVPTEGTWVKSVVCGSSESVSDCVLRLLGQMTDNTRRWDDLCSKFDPFLLVAVDPEGSTGSFALTDEAVAALAERGLRVHVGVNWRAVASGIGPESVEDALRSARILLGDSARRFALEDAYGLPDGIYTIRHYVDFMAEGEWDCALHSLAGVAEKVGASDEFWATLRRASDLMGLSDEQRRQVPGLA